MAIRVKLGHSYRLSQDDEFGAEELCVVPTESEGFGELFKVERESDGKPGYILFQPNGSWWWVRHPDSDSGDNEPWKA